MQNNRTKNTKKNIIWGTLNKIISILMPFFVRTVLIYSLGISYVGINSLFSSILSVLSLADLGFASAIVYSMYKPLAEGDNNTVCALLGFYKKIYRVVGTVILCGGVICLPLLNHLIKGEHPADINIYVVYLIYLADTVISYFMFAYKRSLLIANQKKRIIDNIDSIIKMVFSLAQIVALLLVKNFYIYVIFVPLCTLLDNVACSMMVSKYYPEIFCKNDLDKNIKSDIIEKTKGLFIYKVCGVTRNSLDNIFISMFLGVTPVGIYSNYYYVMSSIRGFMDVVTTSMSASIGNSVATESVEKNYKMLNIFTFLFAWLCGWCTVCLLCLYQPFMKIWIGKANMFSFPVVIAFCIYFYVWTAGDIRSQYTDASGLWWKEKSRSIAETIGNIVLNYVLVQLWGILGIVLATAISIVVIGIPWSTRIVFSNYFRGKNWITYILTQINYAAATILACAVTYYICSFVQLENVFGLVLRGLICIIVPNVCYLILFIKTRIFKESYAFIKEKIKQ